MTEVRIDTAGGILGRDVDTTSGNESWDRGALTLRRCTQVLENDTHVEVIELTFRDDQDKARIAVELPHDACDALRAGLERLWRSKP